MLLPALALLLSACSGGAASAVRSERPAGDAPAPAADGRPTPDPRASMSSGSGTTLMPSEGYAVAPIAFVDDDRRVAMPVWVADTADLRARGLMYRTSVPADAGMLFVFDELSSGAFWMKNVTLPLSIAFVGQDGTVQQIMDMEPCAAEPCARYQPDEPYRYAVEANLGYFARHGIAPGWTLTFGDDEAAR